jgi:regulator of protease activity HflC (stomatin/prohibitin superfamily)
MTERRVSAHSGWFMLSPTIGLFALGFWCLASATSSEPGASFFVGVVSLVLAAVSCGGFFTLQPNEARVLILFGDYVGTCREEGFRWTNPFNKKKRLSLRLRNLDGETLKVNDKTGNPIEISAIVVWRIAETAKAVFDVDDCEHFVKLQSDSAVRSLAGQYAYDHGEDDEATAITLRGSEIVNDALRKELQDRVAKAGVRITEARLNHLAYAPEIASVMLKRQQADAIIAARRKIVDGAVSMVDLALRSLETHAIVALDDERKAQMVSNLLVILCGESEAQPVINTGTGA